jgi:hypothetical protein
MTEKDLILELLRLTSRTIQPEDGNLRGWEPIAANRIEEIRKLAQKGAKWKRITAGTI